MGPTGYVHCPKAGSNIEVSKRLANETHKRLVRQEWNEEERRHIIKDLGLDKEIEKRQNNRLTIVEAIKLFRKSLLRGGTPNTKRVNGSLLKHIELLFNQACAQIKFIEDVRAENIEDMLLLKKQTLFKRKGQLVEPDDISIDNFLGMIRRLFKFLVDREYLVKNPAIQVKYLCEGGQKAREVTPEDEEIKRIYRELIASEGNRSSNWTPLKDIIEFIIESGARESEVFGMEWNDIKGDYWLIRQKKCSDGFQFKPKSKKSNRSYFLTEEMKTILQRRPKVSSFVFPKTQVRILAQCPLKQRRLEVRCGKCPFVANRDTCEFRKVEHSRVRSVKTAWTNVRKKSNTLHLTIHDFRRYHNDKLLNHGLSNEESGALIGNSEYVNKIHYDSRRNERLLREATEKRISLGKILPDLKDK